MSRWLSQDYRLFMIGLGAVLACGCGGTPPNGTAGGSASSAAVAKGSASAAESEAEWPAETTIDLRKLQTLSDAQFVLLTPTRISGVARGKSSAIFEHYRDALEKDGWKLSHPQGKSENTEESAAALLVKGNESTFLSVGSLGFSDSAKLTGDDKSPMQFSIDYLGECDSSKLPQLPGAEKGYGGTVSTVYFTDMNVAATASSVRNMLQTNGWQEFHNPLHKELNSPAAAGAEFRKAANSLRVLVLAAGSDQDRSKSRTSVKYVIGAIGHPLPAPHDAKSVEFDDAAWSLRCTVPRDLAPVAEDCLKAMRKLGYTAPQELAFNEYDMKINFESKEKNFVIAKLHYDALSTQVELQGIAAGQRQKQK